MVRISGTDDAHGECGSRCLTVSGTGDANNPDDRGTLETRPQGCRQGCVAVSGAGDASDEADHHS